MGLKAFWCPTSDLTWLLLIWFNENSIQLSKLKTSYAQWSRKASASTKRIFWMSPAFRAERPRAASALQCAPSNWTWIESKTNFLETWMIISISSIQLKPPCHQAGSHATFIPGTSSPVQDRWCYCHCLCDRAGATFGSRSLVGLGGCVFIFQLKRLKLGGQWSVDWMSTTNIELV